MTDAAAPAHEPPTAPTPPAGALRQCSRCRLFFPAEPGLSDIDRRGWWTCTGCHAAITPDQGPRPTAVSPGSLDSGPIDDLDQTGHPVDDPREHRHAE